MITVHTVAELRAAVLHARRAGKRIGLVPTMGNLHAGHAALVERTAEHADFVVASIFVNPLQFGPREDLATYPRTLPADQEKLIAAGCDLLFAPSVEQMYPNGAEGQTRVSVPEVSEGLCGAARPGHFDGVATVVCKLFHQVLPDVALFGEKDWQQLAVIRRMARDLDLTQPHADAIIGVETVRETDGLARSSRNAYLTAEQRAAAVTLPTAMKAAIAAIESDTRVADALADLEKALLSGGFASLDYAELRDADDLALLDARSDRSMRLLVAARIGKARLIDNMAVAPR